jgi:hypothetical protein
MEESGVPGENQRPATRQRQKISYNVASSTPCLSGIRADNVSDCIGSFKSKNLAITITTAPS